MILSSQAPIRRDQEVVAAYYQAFVIALVICLSPFKGLAYAAPLICGVWFLSKSGDDSARRKAGYGLALAVAVVIAYWILRHEYSLVGGLLAIVTYSTFLFLAIIPTKSLANEKLLDRMTTLVARILVCEALIGIVQAVVGAREGGGFDLGNGDVVQGTIHLSFVADGAFSNPIYAANMVFFLLVLVPVLIAKKRPVTWPLLLGIIAFVLASVIHMILFLAVGLVFSLLWFRPPLPRTVHRFRLASVALLGPLIAIIALSANLSTLNYQAGLFATGGLPKGVMVYRAVYEMPQEYPAMPLIGLGPGQFSSRASLISTGLYFGGLEDPKSVPLIRGHLSPALSDYLLDLWVDSSNVSAYGGSSSAKPFFSWMSVYTEFGTPALIAIFIYCLVLLKRMKAHAQSPQQKWLAVSSGAAICFLLELGFQENYWEVPQAILIGLMLVQVMYANVIYYRAAPEPNDVRGS